MASPTNSPSSGRVEVQYSGTWGRICGHSWDLQEADVVCRQLGYDGALSAPRWPAFGHATGPIWLNELQCGGNETSVSQCSHGGWGVLYCRNHMDAGVVCSQPKGKFS